MSMLAKGIVRTTTFPLWASVSVIDAVIQLHAAKGVRGLSRLVPERNITACFVDDVTRSGVPVAKNRCRVISLRTFPRGDHNGLIEIVCFTFKQRWFGRGCGTMAFCRS